jgi:N-acetylglucosamine transport system permease protein
MKSSNEKKEEAKIRLEKFKAFLRALPAWLIVGPFSLSAVIAIFWGFTVSLRSARDFFSRGAFAIQIPPHIENYLSAWTQMRVGQYFLNSVFYSVVGTLGAVLLAAMISYVLARVEFKMSKPIYLFFLFLMMWPGWVSLLPTYMWMRTLGLIDTYLVLFLGYWLGALPFNCFLLFSFFETLPKELEEAALMDGANAWQIFWRIMFPLARPGVITIGIFQFINIWNDFFSPLIYLRSPEKYPLALGIQLLSVSSTYAADHPRLFAGMLIFLLPILIIYFLLKDRITEGLTVGAIKG